MYPSGDNKLKITIPEDFGDFDSETVILFDVYEVLQHNFDAII